MIDIFESSVRISPNQTFFTFVDKRGQEISFTYLQTRLISAALARRIRSLGVNPGDIVVADLPNCTEFVFLILAAAYGEFTLALIKNMLPESEKLAQTLSLERDGLAASAVTGQRVALKIDKPRLRQLLGKARELVLRDADYSSIIESISGTPRWERSIMGERQDIIDDTIHFAERAAHLFDSSSRAIIVFSKKGSSQTKIIPLTWKQLIDASVCANRALNEQGRSLWQSKLPFNSRNSINLNTGENIGGTGDMTNNISWQCVLPLSTVSGFQVLVRSVVGRTPIRLYGHFDAELVLGDCERTHITHTAFTDKMMQDLLTVDEWRADIQPGSKSRLSEFQCILLMGHALNPRTVERALEMDVRIFASYGIPETSGLMAQSRIRGDFRGGLKLLDSYDVHIVDADEDGFGRLAVKGPGVFSGYMNVNAAFTVDHYFITGDVAALYDGYIYIRNRTADMFVCGGENVYPAEIADVLRHIPGVAAVHVFGIADVNLGKRPIAVIERSRPDLSAELVRTTARQWLTGASMPTTIHVVDALPRTPDGKIDRHATEEMLRDRLNVQGITLHQLRVPLSGAVQTAEGTIGSREVVVVELRDALGRVGLGECVVSENTEGTHASSDHIIGYIRETLAPLILGRSFLHPRDVSSVFNRLDESELQPAAMAAIESAMWDLYGHAVGMPLWKLLLREYDHIRAGIDMPGAAADRAEPKDDSAARVSVAGSNNPRASRVWEKTGSGGSATTASVSSEVQVAAGAIIGLDSSTIMMANAHAAVDEGYKRLKIKVTPDQGFASVRAIRRTYPDLLITLDGNRTFTEGDIAHLEAYYDLGIGWIEEPFVIEPGTDPAALLSRMQDQVTIPLCADEAYTDAVNAVRLLEYPNIHCISIKVSKFGGVENTLRFIAYAKAMGRSVWMGAADGCGVGRRVAAAFEMLPDMVFPGDIGSVSRQFAVDFTVPPYVATNGLICLNPAGFEYGIGCALVPDILNTLTINRLVLA